MWTREQYRDAQRRYMAKHRKERNLRLGEMRKLPRYRFNYARHFAARHSREFSITKEQYILLVTSPCFYCAKSLSEEKGCGLDRKDNKRGYSLDNVLPCCGDCNGIRNDVMTVDEMKYVMTQLKLYRSRQ